ncbi:hypothetical protein N1030_01660 [Desulfovibrio mangrovi]|uniref:hypothetical protein n=1 Tax=Desulfovibrio mangrovi TaxID=2976983 RepID=UPI002246E577|nr:hypothetical protein [Desulfovibrio mangrovi]UZP67701.1 hypothetical protein N1030_01660 [Desulfovibrio mangrovi]
MSSLFDPVAELHKRGVTVRLAAVSGGHIVQSIEDGRKRHALERMAHERWVQQTLARYNSLIMFQLSMAGEGGGYRSVQWLISHGYLRVEDGRYVLLKS